MLSCGTPFILFTKHVTWESICICTTFLGVFAEATMMLHSQNWTQQTGQMGRWAETHHLPWCFLRFPVASLTRLNSPPSRGNVENLCDMQKYFMSRRQLSLLYFWTEYQNHICSVNRIYFGVSGRRQFIRNGAKSFRNNRKKQSFSSFIFAMKLHNF